MDKIEAVVDVKQRKIACVLLQAVFKGNQSVVRLFNEWLTFPTDNMRMVTGTKEEWKRFAEEVNNRHGNKTGSAD